LPQRGLATQGGSTLTYVGCVPSVAELTGLRHLKLGIGGLPRDTLVHLSPLSGLASLQVAFYVSRDRPRAGLTDHEPGGGVVLPSALAHLGALSGLTRLAALSVVDRTPSKGLECVQMAAALLAALPSSPFLTEVRRGGVVGRCSTGGHPPCAHGHGLRFRGEGAPTAREQLHMPQLASLLALPTPIPQLELKPVSMVGAPLDLSLTSRWPLLTRLCLHGTDYSSTVEAVLTSSGAEVTVGDMCNMPWRFARPTTDRPTGGPTGRLPDCLIPDRLPACLTACLIARVCQRPCKCRAHLERHVHAHAPTLGELCFHMNLGTKSPTNPSAALAR
jgi:hypothetical protein